MCREFDDKLIETLRSGQNRMDLEISQPQSILNQIEGRDLKAGKLCSTGKFVPVKSPVRPRTWKNVYAWAARHGGGSRPPPREDRRRSGVWVGNRLTIRA